MKTLLFLALIATSTVKQVFAIDFSTGELDCLNDITNKSQLLLKQIERIHAKYEKKMEIEKLSAFERGPYKAHELLNLTIRKMHIEIVNKIGSYPSAYKSQIASDSVSNRRECVSNMLFKEGQILIGDFEVQWKKAIQKLAKNREFFNMMDNLEKKQLTNPSSRC